MIGTRTAATKSAGKLTSPTASSLGASSRSASRAAQRPDANCANSVQDGASLTVGQGMTRHTTIQIRNQYLNFSAAHFTIFSATERERLHGHNFAVRANITAAVGNDGLCFDYNVMKKKLRALCDGLDEYLLLPNHSPHLEVSCSEDGRSIIAKFADEEMTFLAADTQVLPLANITAEELSYHLLSQLIDGDLAARYEISDVEVFVGSGEGQSASTRWNINEGFL